MRVPKPRGALSQWLGCRLTGAGATGVAPAADSRDDEAISLANRTDLGLVSFVHTQNLARGMRACERIEAGIVGVNTGLISTEGAPFGGVKASGLGREGSKYGIEDYLEIKYVCMGL